jgi:hypothetical protein
MPHGFGPGGIAGSGTDVTAVAGVNQPAAGQSHGPGQRTGSHRTPATPPRQRGQQITGLTVATAPTAQHGRAHATGPGRPRQHAPPFLERQPVHRLAPHRVQVAVPRQRAEVTFRLDHS